MGIANLYNPNAPPDPNGQGTNPNGAPATIQTSGVTLGEGLNAISQQPYINQVNAAQTGASTYSNEALAAGLQRAPTISNPTGAMSRQQLAGVQSGYDRANAGLAQTMGGGGPNAGVATEQAGLGQSIASQMAAAHSGTGGQSGYSQAGAGAAQIQGASTDDALSSQAAAARGSQIGAAQGMAGANYAAQGGLALQQGGVQQAAALAQAQMQQKQQAMNLSQAQQLYQQSMGEQSIATTATNDYLQQQQAAQQAAIASQKQSNSQTSSIWSDIGTGLSDAAQVALHVA